MTCESGNLHTKLDKMPVTPSARLYVCAHKLSPVAIHRKVGPTSDDCLFQRILMKIGHPESAVDRRE